MGVDNGENIYEVYRQTEIQFYVDIILFEYQKTAFLLYQIQEDECSSRAGR